MAMHREDNRTSHTRVANYPSELHKIVKITVFEGNPCCDCAYSVEKVCG